MPFFFRNPNITEEEQLKSNLASIAGGLAGTTAGIYATIPIDARYQTNLLNNARQMEKDKKIARENWKVLLQLAKGQISLDDLPPNDRAFYADQLVKQEEMLNFLVKNPYEAKKSLDDLNQKVHVLHHTNASQAPMRGLFDKKVHAPISKHLPIGLGTLGLLGAGVLAEKYFEKENDSP